MIFSLKKTAWALEDANLRVVTDDREKIFLIGIQ